MCHSYAYVPHHLRSQFTHNLSVGVGPAWLVESSCVLRAATQHPGSSNPGSLLRRSSAGFIWVWMASLSTSSLGCLAMSTTVVSSHLMAWWSFHACSATADFSRVPFWQVSWCSLGPFPAFSSHQCSSCHNCRGFSTQPWPSPLVEGPSSWSALSGVTI